MAAGYSIEFSEVEKPITELVTKFGGKPVWSGEPTWPLSKTTGKPMAFIAQIAIAADLFPNASGKIAYLFMADGDDSVTPVTWESESGDNAVVLQPGTPPLQYDARSDGPAIEKWYYPKKTKRTLWERILYPMSFYGEPQPAKRECEFTAKLIPLQANADRVDRDSETFEGGNKLGGEPDFIQGEEYPKGEGWRLLMQLDSTRVPFDINFGDAGVGYAFLSADGNEGKFLWQCL